MDKQLTDQIWRIRENILPNRNQNTAKLIYTGGSTYQLYFSTIGCRYACTMCNYGFGDTLNEKVALNELEDIIAHFPKDAKVLVLEASGSFLDEREIPKKLRGVILRKVTRIETLEVVVIETHYTTVTAEVLEEISSIFNNTSINVELEFGVESVDQYVSAIYNKNLNLNGLLEVIWEAHRYGIASELNLLLGAPLLDIEEQIQDTLNSIKWAMKNCPKDTTCVLFPINIKKNTLLYYLFEDGQYELISHWEFIEMLSRIPKEYLGRISIAWWGNRFNIYEGRTTIIYPHSCDKCHDELQGFYEAFYTGDEAKKIEILMEIATFECDCKKEFFRRLKNERKGEASVKERYEDFKVWLQSQSSF